MLLGNYRDHEAVAEKEESSTLLLILSTAGSKSLSECLVRVVKVTVKLESANICFKPQHGEAFINLRSIPRENCLRISVMSGEEGRCLQRLHWRAERLAWESLPGCEVCLLDPQDLRSSQGPSPTLAPHTLPANVLMGLMRTP